MNEEKLKSLVDLIDESLAEIEELKKSNRFSASEIKIEGPGAGIAGKPVNGSMGKDEDKDEDDDEDEDEDDKDMDKAEGQNRQADPNGGKHQMDKNETGMPEGTAKAEGQNRQADPNGGKHQMDKAEGQVEKDEDKKKKKKDDEDEDKDDWKQEMKKSASEANTLLKSYVDQRLAPIEGKLEAIIELVKQVADTPAPSKGSSYKNITPLKKSDDESTPLTKNSVVEKLFDLKKSGVNVSSVDIASAELAGPHDLAKIVTKYNIK